jgi:serine/threonine protein kinase
VPWSAPEVISEETAGTIASEVWGLGATVYSLLAGHSPFERMEKGQNTREHLRRRILRATYPRMTRPDVPAGLQTVLAKAMSREPGARYRSALEFAEALRGVQAEIGFAVTPVEVAVDAWAPAPAGVDFADESLRGSVRTVVPHTTARKTAEPASLTMFARDEDTDISTQDPKPPRPVWPWIVGGAAAIAAAVGAVVWAVVAAGGM